MLCHGRHSCRVASCQSTTRARSSDRRMGEGRFSRKQLSNISVGNNRSAAVSPCTAKILDDGQKKRRKKKRKEGRKKVSVSGYFVILESFLKSRRGGRWANLNYGYGFRWCIFFLFFFRILKGRTRIYICIYFQCKIYSFEDLRSWTSFWIFHAVFPKKKENETDPAIFLIFEKFTCCICCFTSGRIFRPRIRKNSKRNRNTIDLLPSPLTIDV